MEIYYEVIGKGYPIICLHGNGENRKIFYQLVNDLKEEYQFILIDTRYHGKSIKKGDLNLQTCVNDINHIINKLNINEYDVIGFSDGANIGLSLALNDKRVKNMVLLSPNSSPKGLKLIFQINIILKSLLLLPFCIYNKGARREYIITKWMLKEPHFTKEDLSKIKIPVLLLSGEHDMIKKEDIDFIGQSLKYCVNEVIAGSNHFMLEEAYKVTKEKIRRFLYACHKD